MKTNQAFIRTLGAVAAGITLGVLFAPDKGSNTRKKIIQKSTSATDDLKKRLKNITNPVSGKYNSLNEELTENSKLENIKKMNKSLGT